MPSRKPTRGPIPRKLISGLNALGIKEWVKPHALNVLDLLGVEHSFTRKPEIFESMKRLALPSAPNGVGPKVLVLSFRGAWLIHGAWEALIAESIRRRGGRPTLFVCSGGLPKALPDKNPACGISSCHEVQPISCGDCLQCGVSMAGSLGLPLIRMDELVDPETARELMSKVDGLDFDEVRNLEHYGIPIGQFVLNSTQWFLCVSDISSLPQGEAVFRAFAKSALVVAQAAPRLLERVAPDVVFTVNGLFFAERIISAEARRRRIRVVSYERGFEPDTLCFSDGIAGHYDVTNLWEQVKHMPLAPAEEEKLDDYLAARRKGLRAPFNYWPTVTESEKEVLKLLDLDPARRTAVLFTNITWDSAAQDRERVFTSMYDWVVETIKLFESMPEAQLIVRIHPAEVRVPGWETQDPLLPRLRKSFPVMPRNVRVVPPESDLSSYTLMRLSRCGLAYTSTAGLEMATEGLPVVVAGEVHYAGKGFTLDPVSREAYSRVVTRALDTDRDPGVRDYARRYSYAFFFQYFLPFPLVSENAPDFIPTLKAEDPMVLDPGGDDTLDRVCAAILYGKDVYASRGESRL